ncbi:MAG TPA: DUF1573 domain-containing protein, partial [Planctomycetaceae bacterium]|nr:DUF1573 domain-containing protein [Planctomycetaceae bacterium]
MRLAPLAVAFLFLLNMPAEARNWAEALFPKLDHDFGTIPRGASMDCSFLVRNPYQDTKVRISGLKRTCGCTDVAIDGVVVLNEKVTYSSVHKVLEPGEEVRINVRLDTRKFVGRKSAQITVYLDQPQPASVRLTIRSFIRQDVVLNPGTIQFGAVTREHLEPRSLDIEYAGTLDWRIERVEHSNEHLDVAIEPWYRNPGQVGYKLMVSPKPTLPAGQFRDLVYIYTNDPASPRIVVHVAGQLLPELIVTPAKLRLGTVRPGQPARKYVLIRARKPFRVTEVKGCDQQFQAEYAERAQTF